MLQNLKQR